jgi:hypothetical protein
LVLVAQVVLASAAFVWPWAVRLSTWADLMSLYSESVDKVSVA